MNEHEPRIQLSCPECNDVPLKLVTYNFSLEIKCERCGFSEFIFNINDAKHAPNTQH